MAIFIDLKQIPLVSINRKFTKNKYTGQLILTPAFRQFKNILALSCVKGLKINPPYKIIIYIEGAVDLDNCLKSIIDTASKYICNDNRAEELHVYMKKIKRGLPGSLKVEVESIIS